MKQLFLFLFAAAALTACNNAGDDSSKGGDSTKTGDTKMEGSRSTDGLAYQVKGWGDWQPGSMDNLKTALNSLKGWENGDMDAATKDFADTVELRLEGLTGKFSRDSLKAMFANERKNTKSVSVSMDDYETVKSKDGKEEWVSLWYKQKSQNAKGDWDSAVMMDDLKMINGKIAVLDEKSRKLGKKM